MPDRALGKLPHVHDPRSLRALDFVAADIPVPARYNFDSKRTVHPLDQDGHGSCTIFALAGIQKRFELKEQGRLLSPMKAGAQYPGLLALYDQINGGVDGGAYMIDALKIVREQGIPLSYRRENLRAYQLAAYAEVYDRTPAALRAALWSFKLLYLGVLVTRTMMDTEDGSWVEADDSMVEGGHALCCTGYTPEGLLCAPSWAGVKTHRLRWSYVEKYADEAWTVTDARDSFGQHIDHTAMLLAAVALHNAGN